MSSLKIQVFGSCLFFKQSSFRAHFYCELAFLKLKLILYLIQLVSHLCIYCGQACLRSDTPKEVTVQRDTQCLRNRSSVACGRQESIFNKSVVLRFNPPTSPK